ncbi:hypothetical protein V1282_003495 [Nitrobacteraceae bacterium AZCC 2146]
MNTMHERKATALITVALTGIGRATTFAPAREAARLFVDGGHTTG